MAAIDRHRFQALLIRLIVGKGNVPERLFVVGDSLYERIVVFAGRIVAPARLGFSDDRLREVIEGAGIGSGAEQFQREDPAKNS